MSDPDRERRERSIGRMSMIAFILAALAALISIVYVRPLPIADDPPRSQPEVTRSSRCTRSPFRSRSSTA